MAKDKCLWKVWDDNPELNKNAKLDCITENDVDRTIKEELTRAKGEWKTYVSSLKCKQDIIRLGKAYYNHLNDITGLAPDQILEVIDMNRDEV